MSNYFNEYSKNELYLFETYVKEHNWLNNFVKNVSRDNTGYHDIAIECNNGKKYTIEIKEDEIYWYSRTGNIGLDYLSVFTYKDKETKNKWSQYNNWIPPEKLEDFENDIDVRKFGKLVTCDADFQLYIVLDDKKSKIVFSALYNNKKFTSSEFNEYIKANYRLRINDKTRYGIEDIWESGAYFINPFEDLILRSIEIDDLNEFINYNK